ncbi:Karyopherin (importin) beta 3 [Plasmopara halstedii]|uniref:Karyopherin (Importin) beta 3 n=1 Tax=Plasmopara halstedii TaxID=4781 RepID=A0A0P1AX99_PLAHL|nr:Karyopherin (importin) beta 3 [Plasmopara halstedii]CEG45916.1 Karyopherin (importin) beta 3 [Plasmopara halstedii]|eukprot:XP_024582285.1 Karyopherin (importin) beta 3 [Plasmopara halstedii]
MQNSSWETLLWSLLAKDNDKRNAAEVQFAALKQSPCSDDLLLGLVHVVHSTSADDVRALAAVLLRRVLLRDAVSLWPRATDLARVTIKCELLAVLEAGERNRGIRRKVCDIVGELAGSILEDGQWDDLLPKLLQWSDASMVILRETALRVMEMVAIFLASQITRIDVTQSENTRLDITILQTLAKGLTDREGRVALNSLRAFGMLLLSLDALDQVPQPELLTSTVPLVLATLHSLLITRQFDDVMEALEILIEVAEPHATIFKPCLREFVETMVQIADVPHDKSDVNVMSDGCRQLAMEFLVSLAEQAPSLCRHLPKNMFVQLVYPVAFKMMLDLQDLDAWDVAFCADEHSVGSQTIDHEISNFDVGSEALERLVGAIGAKRSLPTCFALIQKYAQSENWVNRHAALVGLCQILDVLDDENLDATVRHLFAQTNDSHPRVCCTAVDVIGQLSVDQAPRFQQAYHLQALTVLAHYLEDFNKPRLQAHAATSLRQFIDMCPSELLTPYLDKILHQLFALLQNGQLLAPTANQVSTQAFIAARIVQEQAITAISSVATVAGASFATYYAAVLPPLQQILRTCLHECVTAAAASQGLLKSQSNAPSSFTLGGITLECLSLIGQAVGKQVFSRDAAAILKMMAEMQATPFIVGNELIRTYLLQAWARCCTCLRHDFAPYLPLVMPTLLEAAMQQAEFEVDPSTLSSDDEDDASTDSEDIQLAQVNDKCLSIRTSILEEKATACQLLAGMVIDLEDAFFPYAEQVTQVLAPLLTESVHSDIRASAIRAMPALVKCVAISTAAAPGPSENSQATIKQMVDFALGRLVNALTSEPDVELVVSIMQSMINCLNEACQPHPKLKLNEAQLRELVLGLLVVLGDSFQRRALRRSGAGTDVMEADEDEDEDDAASQSTETQATETELHFVLAECIGVLAKTHGADFFPVFMTLLWDKVTALAAPGCLIEDRQLALFVVDDVLEHCGDAALHRLDIFLPIFMSALREVHEPGLIQAAAFGVGVCASQGGDAFAPHAKQCLQLLHNVVTQPHAYNSEHRNATDNAVAALGKLCEFQSAVVDAATLFPQWLSLLPLRGDLEESLAVLRRLCGYIDDRHPLVLGAPDYQHLGKVVAVLAAVTDAKFLRKMGKSVGEKEVLALRQQLASSLKSLRASVPEMMMSYTWNSLSSSQQSALQELFAYAE